MKKVIIIIPAYNEEKTIGTVIRNILKLNGFNKDIVVIDDGSEDRTALRAKEAGAIVVTHNENLGLGPTFRTGLKAALERNADIIVNIDADGQYDANHIPKLIDTLLKENMDLIIGNRFLDDKELGHNLIKRVGNKIVSIFISKILLRQNEIIDIQSGFRVFNKELANYLVDKLSGKYTYTQEMVIRTIFGNFKIKQISTRFYKREVGKSRLIKNPFIYLFKILIITFKTYFESWLGLTNRD